ncbi:MAG: hypothetical protein K0Q94_6827 [Paenibacillus sp.]|nr:hypothetical protein [Paenibacillus sp.]
MHDLDHLHAGSRLGHIKDIIRYSIHTVAIDASTRACAAEKATVLRQSFLTNGPPRDSRKPTNGTNSRPRKNNKMKLTKNTYMANPSGI